MTIGAFVAGVGVCQAQPPTRRDAQRCFYKRSQLFTNIWTFGTGNIVRCLVAGPSYDRPGAPYSHPLLSPRIVWHVDHDRHRVLRTNTQWKDSVLDGLISVEEQKAGHE